MLETIVKKLRTFLSSFGLIALGGMTFCFGTLWIAQGLASWWGDGRLFDPGDGVWLWVPLLVVLVVVGGLCCRSSGSGDSVNKLISQDAGWSTVFWLGLYFVFILWDNDVDFSFLGTVAFGADVCVLVIGICVCSAIAYGVLGLMRLSNTTRILIIALWLLGYLASWTIGISSHGLSLPVFSMIWLSLALVGCLLCDMTSAPVGERVTDYSWSDEEHNFQSRVTEPNYAPDLLKRRTQTRSARSVHGKIPEDTILVLGHLVRKVTGPIAAALPLNAPMSVRDITVKEVLDRVIVDWRSNENLEGLEQQDIDDLRSFVEAACFCCRNDFTVVGQTIYSACLSALLDDWLENWNANGISGPPV